MNGNVKIKDLCFFTSNMERLFAIRRYFHDNEKRLIIYYILKIQKIITK